MLSFIVNLSCISLLSSDSRHMKSLCRHGGLGGVGGDDVCIRRTPIIMLFNTSLENVI